MPLDTGVKSLKGTKKEILEAVRARTVTVPRKVSGAQRLACTAYTSGTIVYRLSH